MRSHMVQCARHLCRLVTLSSSMPSAPWHRNTCPATLVGAVTECNTTSAQSDTERPFCTLVCFRPLPRPSAVLPWETRNVWRYHVLLTGNFPSTINTPATMMLGLDAHQQANQQATRCHADVLQITRQHVCLCSRRFIAACVPSLRSNLGDRHDATPWLGPHHQLTSLPSQFLLPLCLPSATWPNITEPHPTLGRDAGGNGAVRYRSQHWPIPCYARAQYSNILVRGKPGCPW